MDIDMDIWARCNCLIYYIYLIDKNLLCNWYCNTNDSKFTLAEVQQKYKTMNTMTLMMLYLVSTVNDYTQMTMKKVRQLCPNYNLEGLFNNIVHGQALTCTDIIIM